MRVAIISDIHANWPALEAVLADLAALPVVDDTVCLGDVVGYGGDPVRCLDYVRERGWQSLLGNHDLACADRDVLDWFNEDAATAIRWTVDQLGQERIEWLRGRPPTDSCGGALLVHASPRSPVFEYVMDAESAAANLDELDGGLCFHGHSHLPGVFRFEDGQVRHDYRVGTIELRGPAMVNPGSVGQPRDRDPDSSYGVWDTRAGTFEFRRVPYDRVAAQQSILDAGLPSRFAHRLEFGY
jgi:diadenosine tetraphosphatase ApaH/serine/threonine PP2A family protein phosphatase